MTDQSYFQHPILEWLRTYKCSVYHRLLGGNESLCDTSSAATRQQLDTSQSVVLLPDFVSLQNIAITDSFVGKVTE